MLEIEGIINNIRTKFLLYIGSTNTYVSKQTVSKANIVITESQETSKSELVDGSVIRINEKAHV